MRDTVLTSEAVTAAHPDKLCDRISDAMVDACLVAEPPSGCVAECAIASGVVFLSLRHGGALAFDPVGLAREVLEEAGPPDPTAAQTTVMLDALESAALAPEAVRGQREADRMTTAFGYACDHTASRMPLPLVAAHRIARAIGEAAGTESAPWLSPDAQVQVAVRFRDRRPVALTGVALTVFAGEGAPEAGSLEETVGTRIVAPALEGLEPGPDAGTRLSVHAIPGPGGRAAHSGLTGRKTSEDCYGGAARHSGSALSGKDPSRIDRVAAYAARQAAVSLVAAGLVRECEVQLSYVSGERAPASLEVTAFGSAHEPESALSTLLREAVDFRVDALAERLGLWELPRLRGGGFYRALAAHGHFGRPELDLPWEAPLPLG